MQTTNISWATYSWNPVTGCSHAGPECWNCYAETLHQQWAARETPPAYVSGLDWTQANAAENVVMHPDRLDDPDEYHYPEGYGRVFVGSMTDMFHSEVDPGFVQRALDRCREHPEHIWIWLTKRPHHVADWRLDWPANCWIGTSCGSGPGGEYPSTTHRIEQLRDVEAATKWVSAEPLIEPLGEIALDHIDWLVVGGESGSADVRREMEHEWARDLLRQAREQDVAFYFKQDSGAFQDSSTTITVERDYNGFVTYQQREIQEYPPLPDVTRAARAEG